MNILFTRHGESEANVQRIISNRDLPHPLTAVGVAQAHELAETLLKWEVKSVLASPIVRAQETGHIIAKKLGIPLRIAPALREFDCGRLEGRGDEAAWRAHAAVTRAWDEEQDYAARLQPDGESFDDLKARFLPFVMKIIEAQGEQRDLLLVSHGGLLHQMLPLILANVDRAFTQQHPIGNCELIVTQPQHTNLVCTAWAGIQLLSKPHNPA
jgi:probable phosphoglycerate mutase